MNKTVKLELEKFKAKLFADTFKKGKLWRGYNVYVPHSKEVRMVGLPVVVLEKDGVYRISTHEECFDYLTFVKKAKRGA